MATYNLLVRDSDNIVLDWNRGGSLGAPGAGETIYEDVTIAEDPEVGGTYDGSYTAPTPGDYFDIENGGTPLSDGEVIQLSANGSDTVVLTVQKKDGSDGSDKAGADELVSIEPNGVIMIDKSTVTLDTSDGAEDFTIGPFEAGWKGSVSIRLNADALGSRHFLLEVM